jgi:hypothetical protein
VSVRAKNAAGNSDWSESAQGTPKAATVVPATPGKPVITAAENQLAASWSAVDGAESYEVRIDGGEETHPAKATETTSVTFTDLVNGVEYSVSVRAKNAVGNSDWSESATGTPKEAKEATERPSSPGQPRATVVDNAITISWDGVDGATKYQFWLGTTDDSATAAQKGDDITDGFSITVTVQNTGTYYGWIKAGNSQGYSDFSPVATVEVTPVIGTWRRQNGDRTMTYAFKNDGTVDIKSEFPDGESNWTDTYNSATKKIYDMWSDPPELRGTYSVSGNKLSITEINANSYTRQGTDSGLSGTWRRNYGDGSYNEYVFESGKVTEKYVYNDEVKWENSYTYTVSGTKITMEQLIGSLSESTLNVSMGNGETVLFTRQGSGSGVAGTWKASINGETSTLTVTSSKITMTMGGESEEGPCSISGNNLYVVQEYTYIIDTSVNPHILTITYEQTSEYTKVN